MKSGGIGFVIVLIALAIVLLLAAKSWNASAPALQTLPGIEGAGPISDHGRTEAAEALRETGLPDLREMQQNTDAHSKQVQEALSQVE